MFETNTLDYKLSPYTGLTRESWIEAAKYLLDGVFKNIPDYNSPVLVPRTETDVTYPHKNAEGNTLILEEAAQRFEGLARTMFIAAPLIHIDENTEICGFKLRDYYSNMILQCCTKGGSHYVGDYQSLQELSGNKNPYRAFQQTVETAALVICLDICRDEIWLKYSQQERDAVAEFLNSYAHSSTVPQNWRFFNLLDLAFLHKEGYKIDKNVMLEHAQALLGYYAGDGWYRDGDSFDYYSCWAFNVYAPIWNNWYGYKNVPYIAKRFEENSNKLMETYPDFFDKDGFTNMWGRSNVYRNAATSPLSENLTLKNSSVNPGLARRICSGSLLQFFKRDDFLINGVPAMGFYGQFKPLIQGYSCAESAYWLGKAFLCLALPETSPFWTETENNGSWENLKDGEVKQTVLDGPALCFTNHSANGETILRTGKVTKNCGDIHGMWNYSKLCYNTKYPWESSEVEFADSMQYVLINEGEDTYRRCNKTLWAGVKDGVLYRRQFFDYKLDTAMHWQQAINLADFPVKYGIMRVDKLRLFREPIEVTLGSYGFPDNGTSLITKETDNAKAIIMKGYDSCGNEKQLAMTIYGGWNNIDTVECCGTNPDSKHSIAAYAKARLNKQYGNEQFILISQTITKESHEDFTESEIFPIDKIAYTDEDGKGNYGPIEIFLKNGIVKHIDFDGIEGRLSM